MKSSLDSSRLPPVSTNESLVEVSMAPAPVLMVDGCRLIGCSRHNRPYEFHVGHVPNPMVFGTALASAMVIAVQGETGRAFGCPAPSGRCVMSAM